jgi:hypothetical protein
MLGAALYCAAQQNRPLDFRFGSKAAVTALQHGRLLHLD